MVIFQPAGFYCNRWFWNAHLFEVGGGTLVSRPPVSAPWEFFLFLLKYTHKEFLKAVLDSPKAFLTVLSRLPSD